MSPIRRFVILLVILPTSLVSCKKDKLEGENEIFIGEWEWLESKGSCGTKYIYYCHYTPQSEGYTLSIEFTQKGKYFEYTNESESESGVLVVNELYDEEIVFGAKWRSFDAEFKPNRFKYSKEESVNGRFVNQDTIIFYTYPYDNDVYNYFVRK